MTWQGSGTGGPGDPSDDATRTDWPGMQPPSAPGSPPPAMPGPPPTPPYPATPVPPAAGEPASPWAAPGGGWGTPPPTGGQYAVPGAPGLVYAGAIPRAAAFLVDSFLLAIIVGIVSAPFGGTNLDMQNPTQLSLRGGIGSVIGAVVEAAYFAFLWSSTGRATLGMRLFGLQVGNVADGSRLRPEQAIRRWLAYGSFLSVFAIAPATAGLIGLVQLVWTIALLVSTVSSPTKQGLHDRFAGSAVVRSATAGNGAAIGCLLVLIVLPIIAVLAIALLAVLGGQMSSILSAVGESI